MHALPRIGLAAVLTCLLFASTLAQEASPSLPAPDSSEFRSWCDHVRADASELAFESISWGSSFAEGMARARREGRPFLFYAMNGHPLGCT